MRKERDITIKVIENNHINYKKIALYFAQKFIEENKNAQKKKS